MTLPNTPDAPPARAQEKSQPSWPLWLWAAVIVGATVVAWPVGAAIFALACTFGVPESYAYFRREGTIIAGLAAGFAVGAAPALGPVIQPGVGAFTLWLTSLTLCVWALRFPRRELLRDLLAWAPSAAVGALVGFGMRRRMEALDLGSFSHSAISALAAPLGAASLLLGVWIVRDLIRRRRIDLQYGAPQADFYRKAIALRIVLLAGTAPLILTWILA